MLWTILQSFSFIPNIASEELIFEYFLQIEPFGCHDNQSMERFGQKVFVWLDHTTNISKKIVSK